jgi:hypothetical protein
VNSWCDLTLHSAPLEFLDVFNAAAEKDRAYFRSSREKGVGQRLEKFCADRDSAQSAFVQTLVPIELTLQTHAYLGGASANYSDYLLLGSLQWARCVSGTAFLSGDSATTWWFERRLDLHDAYARNAPTVRDLVVG